jgi:hypothetical protein
VRGVEADGKIVRPHPTLSLWEREPTVRVAHMSRHSAPLSAVILGVRWMWRAPEQRRWCERQAIKPPIAKAIRSLARPCASRPQPAQAPAWAIFKPSGTQRYLKVIRSVRLRVEALFFKGSFVAFELF